MVSMFGVMKVEAEWQKDKRWSDIFIPEIKGILGTHLIGEPPLAEDSLHNTDLMVLKLDAVRIGCRIRKFDYLNFSDEFTLRASRRENKTELAKVIEGWGDYFFYGFSDRDGRKLSAWMLGDLKVFRLWFTTTIVKNEGRVPGQLNENYDGSSTFRAFNINALPKDFIVARKPWLHSV